MSKRRPIEVSDHAVLRYLERVGGFDIEGLRRDIAERLSGTVIPGPQSVVIDGHRFLIRDGANGPVVVSVLEKGWSPGDHRQLAAKAASRRQGRK